jgi:hypothetical protein
MDKNPDSKVITKWLSKRNQKGSLKGWMICIFATYRSPAPHDLTVRGARTVPGENTEGFEFFYVENALVQFVHAPTRSI